MFISCCYRAELKSNKKNAYLFQRGFESRQMKKWNFSKDTEKTVWRDQNLIDNQHYMANLISKELRCNGRPAVEHLFE